MQPWMRAIFTQRHCHHRSQAPRVDRLGQDGVPRVHRARAKRNLATRQSALSRHPPRPGLVGIELRQHIAQRQTACPRRQTNRRRTRRTGGPACLPRGQMLLRRAQFIGSEGRHICRTGCVLAHLQPVRGQQILEEEAQRRQGAPRFGAAHAVQVGLHQHGKDNRQQLFDHAAPLAGRIANSGSNSVGRAGQPMSGLPCRVPRSRARCPCPTSRLLAPVLGQRLRLQPVALGHLPIRRGEGAVWT